MDTIRKENKMGTMPIPKLLLSISLPMILSMFVQALYNVVDSIFVAKISEDALTAVSLAFPIQNLLIAISAGTGVGINALLSRRLGEHHYDEANTVARNGIFLSIVSALIVAVVGVVSAHAFFSFQTSNDVIVKYGTQYMVVITLFSIGIFLQITLERLIQSTGKTIYNMITQSLGAIINIVLDPIFIFGLFGFPRMEVLGAAIATIVGQLVACALSLYYNVHKNKEINLNMKKFRPCKHTINEIYKVGIPSIIMQAIGSVMTFGMNKILLLFSSTAVAVFGVYFKLQSFVFMPIFGLNNGMVPIIAYNYGAKEKKRIVDTFKLSTWISILIMTVGMILFQTIPETMLSFFEASKELLEIGIPALRIISLSFPLAGYCIICTATYQALGNGMYSLIASVIRQLIVILPVAYIFAKTLGLYAVWFSFPIAELVCTILSTILLFRIYKQKIASMDT